MALVKGRGNGGKSQKSELKRLGDLGGAYGKRNFKGGQHPLEASDDEEPRA